MATSTLLGTRHPTAGPIVHVEAFAQQALNDYGQGWKPEAGMATLREQLQDERLSTIPVTRAFNVARAERQAVLSTATLLVIRSQLLPTLIGRFESYDDLSSVTADPQHPHDLPVDYDPQAHDTYVLTGDTPPAAGLYRDCLRSATFWPIEAAKQMMAKSERDPEHPFYPLHKLIDETKDAYNQTFAAWKAGPGAKRLPVTPIPDSSHADILLRPLSSNAAVALNQIVALAGSYAINHAEEADAPGATQWVRDRLGQASWVASTGRHMGKRLDGQGKIDVQATRAIMAGSCALNIAALLDQNASPADIRAAFNKYPAAQSPAGCPHPSLTDGPWEHVAMCPGAVRVRFADAADRQQLVRVAEACGVPWSPDCYVSSAEMLVTIGFAALKTTLLPALCKQLDIRP